MAYIQYNPNPKGVLVGDCVIRAISKLTEKDWDTDPQARHAIDQCIAKLES